MMPSLPKLVLAGPPEVLTVFLDGCIVGSIASSQVEKVVAHLRRLKVSSPAVVCFFKILKFSLLPFILYIFLILDIDYKVMADSG